MIKHETPGVPFINDSTEHLAFKVRNLVVEAQNADGSYSQIDSAGLFDDTLDTTLFNLLPNEYIYAEMQPTVGCKRTVVDSRYEYHPEFVAALCQYRYEPEENFEQNSAGEPVKLALTVENNYRVDINTVMITAVKILIDRFIKLRDLPLTPIIEDDCASVRLPGMCPTVGCLLQYYGNMIYRHTGSMVSYLRVNPLDTFIDFTILDSKRAFAIQSKFHTICTAILRDLTLLVMVDPLNMPALDSFPTGERSEEIAKLHTLTGLSYADRVASIERQFDSAKYANRITPNSKMAGWTFSDIRDATVLLGLLTDEVGEYSASSFSVATAICDFIKSTLPDVRTIIDATAGIGGDTRIFAKRFDHVTAIELLPDVYSMMMRNMNLFGVVNMDAYVGSCVTIMVDVCRFIKADLLHIDPPWGGVDYYKDDALELNMVDESYGIMTLAEVCDRLSDRAKYISIKVPRNFNLEKFGEELQSWTIKCERLVHANRKDERKGVVCVILEHYVPVVEVEDAVPEFTPSQIGIDLTSYTNALADT
jgi:hypothetical protein